jgi:hypothetical protein
MGCTQLISSYDVANNNSAYYEYSGSNTFIGEAFVAGAGGSLCKAQFDLATGGSPTGSVYAKLYSCTGTPGTDGNANTLLATSDAVDITTIPNKVGPPYNTIDFTFSGAQMYNVIVSTNYVIGVSFAGGDSSNYLKVGVCDPSTVANKNFVKYVGASFQYNAAINTGFFAYKSDVSFNGMLLALD